MKEFIMLFRSELLPEARFGPEQMQEVMKAWQNWMGGMAAQDKLASSGNRLGSQGKVVKPNGVVIDGPFAETKEIISGYIAVRADSFDEAAEMAKGCPLVVGGGGQVEVRDIAPMTR
jgi:hypothetical protein